MPERLYQLGFDEKFQPAVQLDVTPEGFRGLEFARGVEKKDEGLSGRFVREVRERVLLRTPQDAARYLQERIYTPFEAFDQEEIWILLLNTKAEVTHEAMVYRGTVNSSYVRVAELLKEAIKVNAPALILSHCHPSGDPTPSPEDVRVTMEAHEAAELLDISLADHIIVGKDRWVSLKERGLGFE